jgi:hypothetical protein
VIGLGAPAAVRCPGEVSARGASRAASGGVATRSSFSWCSSGGTKLERGSAGVASAGRTVPARASTQAEDEQERSGRFRSATNARHNSGVRPLEAGLRRRCDEECAGLVVAAVWVMAKGYGCRRRCDDYPRIRNGGGEGFGRSCTPAASRSQASAASLARHLTRV